MHAYINDKGMIFTAPLRVVLKKNRDEILAEPGDLLLAEGDLLYNVSRAVHGNLQVMSRVDDSMLVEDAPTVQ